MRNKQEGILVGIMGTVLSSLLDTQRKQDDTILFTRKPAVRFTT